MLLSGSVYPSIAAKLTPLRNIGNTSAIVDEFVHRIRASLPRP